MSTEIEAKIKVSSHKEVVEKLSEVGAEFLEEQHQTDCYVDDINKTLTKTDRCLRLRCQVTNENSKIFLTYKGAKEKSKFKTRQEIEIAINDFDSAAKMLSALGYEKLLVFEKKRRIWQLGDCEIALDELPLLGSFVEIEGPDGETIADVQKYLGMANLPHISESYASLVAEKLQHQS